MMLVFSVSLDGVAEERIPCAESEGDELEIESRICWADPVGNLHKFHLNLSTRREMILRQSTGVED